MKKLMIGLTLCAVAFVASAAEYKKVCIDKYSKDGKVLVGKDGKPQKECRTMKIRKKLKGTPVPKK